MAGEIFRAPADGRTVPNFATRNRSFFLYTGSVKSTVFGTVISRGVAILCAGGSGSARVAIE